MKDYRECLENNQEWRQTVIISSAQFVQETRLPDHMGHHVTITNNDKIANSNNSKDNRHNTIFFQQY